MVEEGETGRSVGGGREASRTVGRWSTGHTSGRRAFRETGGGQQLSRSFGKVARLDLATNGTNRPPYEGWIKRGFRDESTPKNNWRVVPEWLHVRPVRIARCLVPACISWEIMGSLPSCLKFLDVCFSSSGSLFFVSSFLGGIPRLP
jgi:hypothetical protein